MSGLTKFFRDHLPVSSPNTDYNTSLQAIDQEQGSPHHLSLVEQTEHEQGYNDCKTRRREFLLCFVDNRILGGNESEDDEASVPSSKRITQHMKHALHPEESQETEQGLETQALFVEDPTRARHTEEDDTEDESEQFSVPHVTATRYHVEYLSDLDLLTKRLTLLLCTVTKVWKYRQIKRCSHTQPSRRQSLYSSAPQFPFMGMDFVDDDGPLSPCYRTVLSLEVQQFNTSILRQHAESSMMTTIPRQSSRRQQDDGRVGSQNLRLRVFLYKSFATHMQGLLARCPKDCTAVVSFNQIPAKCIFPVAAMDWLDRHDLCDCCLVIGDDSLMRVSEEALDDGEPVAKDEPVPMRFDDDGMILYVAFVKDRDAGIFHAIYSMEPGEEGVVVQKLSENDNPFADYYAHKKKQDAVSTQTRAVTRPNKRSEDVDTSGPTQQTGQQEQHQTTTEDVNKENRKGRNDARFEKSRQAETVANSESETIDSPPVQPSPARNSPGGRKRRRAPSAGDHEAGVSKRNSHGANGAFTRTVARKTSAENGGHQEKGSSPNGDGENIAPKRNGEKTNGSSNQSGDHTNRRPARNGEHRTAPQSPGGDLNYEKINDLSDIYDCHRVVSAAESGRASDCIINLFGVAISFSSPKLTKRGEWMLGVSLVDESLPLMEEDGSPMEHVSWVQINIFEKDKKKLPKIRYAGDVIRIHRVKLQKWNEETQILGLRGSSYVVFRGNVDDPAATSDWEVLPTAYNPREVSDEEHERFKSLWHWAQKRFLTYPTMKLAQSFQLCDVTHQGHQVELYDDSTNGDLTCMITEILTAQRSEISPRGFLRVWDGSGPPLSDPYPGQTPVNANGDPPAAALVEIAHVVKKLQFIRQNPDFTPPKALTGRVVNVAIWEESHWDLVQEACKVGSFIRLRNVRDGRLPNSDFRCLLVIHKSSLTPLPNLTYEVVRLLENHNSRILRNEPLNPQSGLLPLNWESTDVLMDVRAIPAPVSPPAPPTAQPPAQSSAQQPDPASTEASEIRDRLEDFVGAPAGSRFSGSAHVVGLIPSRSQLSATGLEQICVGDDNGQPRFVFAVRLKDDLGFEVDVIVDDDNNNSVGQILVGMSASSALQNSSGALYNLHRMIQEKETRKAVVWSMEYNGSKFFVLESLESK